MAVTTWSFGFGFESWTFREELVTGVGSASRTHVSGAIRVRLVLPSAPPTDRIIHGFNTSPVLGATTTGGDTVAADISATSDAVNMSTRITAFYSDATNDTIDSSNNNNARTVTLNLTGGKTLDTIEIRFRNSTNAGAIDHTRDLLEVRLTTAVAFVGTGQKPLGIDVDLWNGGKIYTTYWDGDTGGDLKLREYSSSLVLQNTYIIADNTATITDIDQRTFFLSPYTPAFFGTASLDDIIYVYGRWDDAATIRHVAKSVDGGASFVDIGDSATWLTDWVGGFFADDANTLYAFVNGGTPALYRSLNGGTSWTSLSTTPFDVDPHSVSKHPDGRILIANRINEAQMAAYAVSPYSSWTDATGSPSFPTAGGGARSIIWVV